MQTWGIRAGLGLASILVFTSVIAFILWPVTTVNNAGVGYGCLSNVKQVGLAHIVYSADFDERFPPVDWVPAIRPHLKYPDSLQCTTVAKGESGYAFNRFLANKAVAEKAHPEEIALVFEVDDLTVGAVADRVAPLHPPRHKDRLMISFADGHGQSLPFHKIGGVQMQPVSGASRKRKQPRMPSHP